MLAADTAFSLDSELEPRLELGFNLGGMNTNDRESYFWESSFFYPEISAWANLGDKMRFGLSMGFIYVGYEDTTQQITKNISIFPTLLEMSVLHIEPSFNDQNLFMELGFGVGYFISAGDIYKNANSYVLKIGTGLMTRELIFAIYLESVICRAESRAPFAYTIDNTTKNINTEMDMGGVSFMLGLGTRY